MEDPNEFDHLFVVNQLIFAHSSCLGCKEPKGVRALQQKLLCSLFEVTAAEDLERACFVAVIAFQIFAMNLVHCNFSQLAMIIAASTVTARMWCRRMQAGWLDDSANI